MVVKNVLEHIVWQQLDEVLDRFPAMCRCEKCRADIAAYTLNHMKPHYVVSEKGALFAKTPSLDASFKVELLIIMSEAVKQVQAHPRHE